MGSDKRSHFLIACRYVPHDQWFYTNTSPSWKIKHLKQSIIAKALNLPFDRRSLMDDVTAHPPSPITFAPIEGVLQESEFSSGPRSYEVDKTQADHRIQGPGSEGRNLTHDFRVAGMPEGSPGVPVVEPPFAEYEDQISTKVFTLIRFSTGQILEEHSLVSWYNLAPHELLELHCSSPPSTFAQTLIFGNMLMNGGSITFDVPTPTPGSHKSSNANSDRHASSSSTPAIPPESRTATLSLALAEPPRLTSLPRHDLPSYAEPYWEGWVRVLRIMWRSDLGRSPAGLSETFPRANTLDLSRMWKADNGLNHRRTKTKEWRERWAVIRNGVLTLCKNRDDPTCTRLPLSALASLCGAEYFSSGHSDNEQLPTNLPDIRSDGDNYKRPNSSHSNLAPTIRASRPTSFSGSSRVTPVEIEDIGTRKYMLTATSSSATAPRVLSSLMTESNATRIGPNKLAPLSATPTLSDHTTLFPIDPERSRRERAAVREWERERMQKEIAEKARPDKPAEYARWDDFVIFGGKSKTRSKEKERDRENEKEGSRSGKFREEKEQKSRKNTATSARHPPIGEERPEKDKDRNREDRQHGKLQDHQDRFSHTDDRYIPGSREEAIAKGLLIVCAKFRIGAVEATNKAQKKEDNTGLRPIPNVSLDTPIASNDGDESGSNESWAQGDRRRFERNVEWQRPQASESMKFLPPPRKASLPGLGLAMLTSGGNITPVGNMFGGFFGNKDRDSDKAEKLDKQDASHLRNEEEKEKLYFPGDSIRSLSTGTATLRGTLDDYHVGLPINPTEMNDLKRLNLSVDTATLSSANYANDRQLEGQDGPTGYHGAGYGRDDKHREQRADKEQKRSRKNEDRVEWVVMDLGTEIAYNSFLRILHRHFPSPMQSSFIPVPSPFQPPSPNPSHNVVPDMRGVLPYPEWRRDVVFRARSQGMRELGRPLELSFKPYNWETQATKLAQPHKSPNEPGGNGYIRRNAHKRRKNVVSETDHGSDDDNDDTFGMEYLMLDDSDDESEDESARWWQDIPRQWSLEGKDFESSTTGYRPWSGTEENADEYSPSSPNILFTDPFTFSPTHQDFGELILSSPGSRLDMEERLRPSISSSTLASNNTSSSMSSRSMMFGASSSNLKGSVRSVLSDVDSPTGMSWQNSPGSYQPRSYPRRIVSPSQTLSSPSSNESLGSYPYQRLPPRPFSPNSDIYLPNPYRQPSGSTSVLHHSISMPNASTWRSMPSSSGGIQADIFQEQPVTAPPVLRNLQKPILSAAQIHRIETETDLTPNKPHDDPLSYDGFSTNIDVLDKPILTLAQIHQIETETEARIGRDYTGLIQDPPSFGNTDSTTKHKMSTPLFNETSPGSVFQQEPLVNDRYERGDNTSLEREHRFEQPRVAMGLDDFELLGDGGPARSNVTRRFMNAGVTRAHPTSTTSPVSFRDQAYMDSASISAKAILRRVRSGSSLQTPMGVHFEESEEDDGDGAQI